MLQDRCIKPEKAKGQAEGCAGSVWTGHNAFKPGVYWFWHRLPGPDEIKNQLGELKKAGYGMVFIQPRLAFPRAKYLSPEYLKTYDLAMVYCNDLGLNAVLYDDYNWISGHAGGRTVAAFPEVRERQLFWSTAKNARGRIELKVSGIRSLLTDGLGPACGDWLYDGGVPSWSQWALQNILAYHPAREPGQPVREVQDLTRQGRIESVSSQGCVISINLPDGFPENTQVTAFVSAQCHSSRLINYLHPEAGKAFMRVGYEPFAQSLARHLGAPLTAIFFDQPYSGFYTWEQQTGNVLNSLMFHESLRDEFQARHPVDIARAWLALAAPDAAESAKLRCDFFDTYGRIARQSFFEPLRQWAREHGLAFSGHELLGCVGQWGPCGGLEGLDSRVNFGADHFALDAYKDISAVDACNSQPQLSVRLGASLAKGHGRTGCLVEQYFAAPGGENPADGHWGLTLDELRSLSIRHLLQGARQVVFHGYCQTDGWSGDPTPLANPRHDFAPGINYEPWFAYHTELSCELEHLAQFMAQGEERAPLAVFYPLRTYWYGGADHLFNAESAWWHQWLSKAGYAFDLVDESQLLAGELNKYPALILPGVEVLAGSESVNQLSRFLQNGGLLIASSLLPRLSQTRGMDWKMDQQVRELFISSKRAVSLPAVSVCTDLDNRLSRLLAQEIEPAVRINAKQAASGQLWTWTGEDDAGWRIALFNESQEACRVDLAIQQPGYIPQISPGSGLPMRNWPWYEQSADACRAWVDMEPNHLACFRFRKATGEDRNSLRLTRVPEQVIVRPALRDETPGFCTRLALEQPGSGELVIHSATKPEVQALGVEINCRSPDPGSWQVSYGSGTLLRILQLDGQWLISRNSDGSTGTIDPRHGWQTIWPDYSGEARYETRFDLPECDGPGIRWELILPRVVCAVTCFLNGKLIAKRGWAPYRFELPAEILSSKDNHLCLEIANTAANRYLKDTSGLTGGEFESSLIGIPRLQPVKFIELNA